MHASRISDVATARHAIRDGLLDLVGMTRPQMADPHLVAKVAAGEEDRIRPCVGANYCLDAIYQSGDAKCIHNPATGREQTLSHVVPPGARATPGRGRRRRTRRPRGRPGARRAGSRGGRAGGGGRARRTGAAGRGGGPPTRPGRDRRLARVARPSTPASSSATASWPTPTTVLAERPDVVVVATGGLPDTSFLDEGEQLVTDTWDVMSGAAHPQGRVLVYDDNGAEPALDAAELLAVRGAAVELVTPERTVGTRRGQHELAGVPAGVRRARRHPHPRATADRRAPGRRRRAGGGAAQRLHRPRGRAAPSTTSWSSTARCRTTSSTSTWCRTPPTAAPSTTRRCWPCDPSRSGSNADGGFQLFRIGDAVASRNIHAAVYDALRLCSAI